MPVLHQIRILFLTTQTLLLLELDVDAKSSDLVAEHVERHRGAGFERVRALDHRLVDLRAALDVVGLHRQEFLKDVRRAVRLEAPHFHLAEALAARAGLAAEGLLRDQRVRARCAGVDLVVDEMVQLHHVDVAHRRPLLELLARAAVRQLDLAAPGHLGVELAITDLLVAALALLAAITDRLVRLVDGLVDLVLRAAVEDGRHGLETTDGCGPPEVGLEDLPDVHARRHAQRVEEDVDRRAVFEERHVFLGNDAGDDALVPVAAGHLVTDGKLALRRDVDLDHLEHARRQLVAALHVLHLAGLLLEHGLHAGPEAGVGVEPLLLALLAALDPVLAERLDLFEHDVGDLALGDLLAGAGVDHLRAGYFVDLGDHLFEDADRPLVHFLFVLVDVLLQRLLLLVAHVHATAEAASADDDAFLTGGHFQRVVLHVFAGPAEDRVEQLLFGRKLGFALRRDLADEDVAGADARPDADDAVLVEVRQRTLAHVGDVPRELFAAELRLANFDVVLLDVNRGERVVLHEPVVDDDRVFEVVAVVGHERDEHVTTQGELALQRRGAVGQDLVFLDPLTLLDDRLLVEARPLVEPDELAEDVLIRVVDQDARAVDVRDD